MELPQLPKVSDLPRDGAPDLVRKIYTEQDMVHWQNCQALSNIELIISRFAQAVRDKPNSASACYISDTTNKIVAFLQSITELIKTVPLDPNPQRFGNRAFRHWVQLVEQRSPDFVKSLVSEESKAAAPELEYHLNNAFGSPVRIDYGTGHELSFLCFLLVLRLVGVLEERDEEACVTRIFAVYIDCCRELQKVFRLEPAGSKGVWGLDDHQHLVYLWGASQLRSNEEMKPSIILSPQSGQSKAHDYLFLSSILHVNQLKRGAMSAHSPMLHSIGSDVKTWSKVETGLTRMYRGEVLLKLPVVQHIRFGVVLAWKDAQGNDLPSSSDGKTESTLTAEQESNESVVGQVPDETAVAPWAMPAASSIGTRFHAHQAAADAASSTASASEPVEPQPFVTPAPFSRRRSSIPTHPSPLRASVDLPDEQSIDEQS